MRRHECAALLAGGRGYNVESSAEGTCACISVVAVREITRRTYMARGQAFKAIGDYARLALISGLVLIKARRATSDTSGIGWEEVVTNIAGETYCGRATSGAVIHAF